MSANTLAAPAVPSNILHGTMVVDNDDDEGGTYVVCFSFDYDAGGIRVNFSIDPSTTEPEQWTEFVRKARAGESAEVTTCQCNGDVAISHERGVITLKTARYGAGGDGDLDVGFPIASSIDAIDTCARAFAAHEAIPNNNTR